MLIKENEGIVWNLSTNCKTCTAAICRGSSPGILSKLFLAPIVYGKGSFIECDKTSISATSMSTTDHIVFVVLVLPRLLVFYSAIFIECHQVQKPSRAQKLYLSNVMKNVIRTWDARFNACYFLAKPSEPVFSSLIFPLAWSGSVYRESQFYKSD